jgi:hypothetical protein
LGEPAALIFGETKMAYIQEISKRANHCGLLSDSKILTREKKFPVAYINKTLTVLYELNRQDYCAVSFLRGLNPRRRIAIDIHVSANTATLSG